MKKRNSIFVDFFPGIAYNLMTVAIAAAFYGVCAVNPELERYK
jgi:hypothetical protein